MSLFLIVNKYNGPDGVDVVNLITQLTTHVESIQRGKLVINLQADL